MKDQVKKAFEEMEKNGWITVNSSLNREAISLVFIEILRDIPVRKALEAFNHFFD